MLYFKITWCTLLIDKMISFKRILLFLGRCSDYNMNGGTVPVLHKPLGGGGAQALPVIGILCINKVVIQPVSASFKRTMMTTCDMRDILLTSEKSVSRETEVWQVVVALSTTGWLWNYNSISTAALRNWKTCPESTTFIVECLKFSRKFKIYKIRLV
jgi:hypothetical protein